MTDQTERADLARVYRAIGNSKAPMPESIGTFPDGDVYLVFDKGNEPAVRVWAEAIGATVGRSTVSASGVHRFGTLDGGGKAGTWLGRCVHVYTYVHDEHPATGPVVLGTGDEPADEAIVPAPVEVEQPQDWYFTWGAGQKLPDGSDAENRYTIISGTHASARTEMLQRFGNTWCDQYGSADRAGVDQFRMKRVMPLAWPKRFEPDGTLRTTHDDPDDDLAQDQFEADGVTPLGTGSPA